MRQIVQAQYVSTAMLAASYALRWTVGTPRMHWIDVVLLGALGSAWAWVPLRLARHASALPPVYAASLRSYLRWVWLNVALTASIAVAVAWALAR